MAIEHNKSTYKWLVLAASICITWMNFGLIFCFGALFLAILDTYGESRSSTATVHSVLMSVTMCFGVVSGLLVSRFGHWKVAMVGSFLVPAGFILAFFARSIIELNIYIGVISAVGISMTFISSAVALGKVFTGSRRLLALALQNSAISVSGLTYPYLFEFLLDKFALNGTFLVLGGIFLNSFLPVLVLKGVQPSDIPNKVTENDDDESTEVETKEITDSKEIIISVVSKQNGSEVTDRKNSVVIIDNSSNSRRTEYGLCSIPYIFLVLGVGLSVSAINGYSTVVLDIFKWKGYNNNEGLISFLPFNIFSLFARIIPGLVKQKRGVNCLILPVVFSVSGAVGQLIILFSSGYIATLIGAGMSGITAGGVISAVSVAVVNVVGQGKFPVAFGLLQTTVGVASSATGPIYGAMRDETGSYQLVLALSVVLLVAGTVSFLVCMTVRYARRKRKEQARK